eukprot:3715416-Pyramimonas_sp.AAC.1
MHPMSHHIMHFITHGVLLWLLSCVETSQLACSHHYSPAWVARRFSLVVCSHVAVITISRWWCVVISAVQLRLFAGLGNASHSFNCSKFRLRGSLLFQGFQSSH